MTERHAGRHVVVTGPMGVGKSTTSEALALQLGRVHRDSDRDVERLMEVPGREVADVHGIDVLHRLETAVLFGALASHEPLVVSAAASIVDDPLCRTVLAGEPFVVALDAPVEDLVRRAASGSHRRAMSPAIMRESAERRGPVLRALADLSLSALDPTEELVERIVAALG